MARFVYPWNIDFGDFTDAELANACVYAMTILIERSYCFGCLADDPEALLPEELLGVPRLTILQLLYDLELIYRKTENSWQLQPSSGTSPADIMRFRPNAEVLRLKAQLAEAMRRIDELTAALAAAQAGSIPSADELIVSVEEALGPAAIEAAVVAAS